MSRKLISSGSTFENDIGYSRAVVEGKWVFVSGTTGYDYSNMSIPEDVVAQTEQCFINIAKALKEAGAGLEHVVRVMYILPQATDFSKCWPMLKKYFGTIHPTTTMISAGLADPQMKIKIQITTLIP